MTRWAVILAGGVGSRFWPLSTPERPKQLLPLVNDEPLLVNTFRRLGDIVPMERTLVLTNASLVDAIASVVPSLPVENIIAEPKPAGTAAALAWAAKEIERRTGPESTMLCVHADWAIDDVVGYRSTLLAAADIAWREHALVTIGIVPSRADPGFGYIQPGERVGNAADASSEAYKVARFVEKPTRERAAQMVEDGYLWNSGIFAWSVGNESATGSPGGIAYFRAMRDFIRSLDPERFVTFADDNLDANGNPRSLDRGLRGLTFDDGGEARDLLVTA